MEQLPNFCWIILHNEVETVNETTGLWKKSFSEELWLTTSHALWNELQNTVNFQLFVELDGLETVDDRFRR